MTSASEILKFNFLLTTFQQSANKIIRATTIHQIENRIAQLKCINERLGDASFAFDDDSLKSKTFKKFKFSFSNNKQPFTKRELRAVIYSLDYTENNLKNIFCSELEMAYAIELLNSSWRESFLKGLILFLFKNWESKNSQSLKQLRNFISKQLETYSGSNKQILNFKRIQGNFLVENGNEVLGLTLARMNKPIQEATKILGVPESWFSYSYFSRVIVTYYEKNKANIINEIENLNDVLLKHNSSITSKRLISKMIIQANQSEFATLQDKLKKIAFIQIGDPSNISNWIAFENATESEKDEIIQGRKILNEWITQQFINVFFNVCINDERRKMFWLRFASKISSFKVYGPKHTRTILKRDEKIAEYVDARFETVSSRRDVSAFILYIGDYMLIEFSNEGYACCAYKNNSLYKPSINHELNSVDDFRNSSLQLAIQTESGYNYLSDEGRLFHSGNWEIKFNEWIEEKVLKTKIDSNRNIHELNAVTKSSVQNQLDKRWESKTLLWSSTELPGFKYSHNMEAWWKSKD